jgi:hypothetical protein
MADLGYIKSELAAFEGAQKTGLQNLVTYLLNNLSFARLDRGRATNAQLYYLDGTTSSNANTEFSIAHGLNSAPSYLIPVMPLNEVGAQLVPLTVSRAADDRRVYLKSSSTGAAITVMVG